MDGTKRRVDRAAPTKHRSRPGTGPYLTATMVTAVALGAAALINRHLAKKAETNNPPSGTFLDIDGGARLHYVERGSGEPLVFLHGNGSMIEDFESSGLIDLAARDYKVIVFDRPGFGHSNRPRHVVWTPDAQAEVIARALSKLGVRNTLVFGHSWGASVATALALKHPTMVRGLVLASGYYYPTLRLDIIAMAAPAVPLLGDLMAYTIAPLVSRLIWPLMLAKVFGPQPVPEKFAKFPKEMALRPSQIRASAVESTLMIPDALRFHARYGELKMPVVIIAGEEDKIVDTNAQSVRLHADILQSEFQLVKGAGHMIQQTATDDVFAAIDRVAGLAPVQYNNDSGRSAAPDFAESHSS